MNAIVEIGGHQFLGRQAAHVKGVETLPGGFA